ncbi:hypothetical protein MHM83_10855 [Tenacibaculum sp. Mcav3-52]|uniref:hypothetical protein n=1 Tax=Tenacibaculum sp. Mcav3-52 TaxID=2917762 RepID=UPI001EF31943|nr:hypothetical protein [Tenacibaculum sp. Mcav3-52]MCG7502371.1 hypothetical protein [Tenacibaculum sp. Mcav3-52]
MNISELDKLCKVEARKVFETFKETILTPPFIEIKNTESFIDDSINSQISQVYGTKIMKTYIEQVKSEQQMKYLQNKIKEHKEILIKTALNFAKKNLKRQS